MKIKLYLLQVAIVATNVSGWCCCSVVQCGESRENAGCVSWKKEKRAMHMATSSQQHHTSSANWMFWKMITMRVLCHNEKEWSKKCDTIALGLCVKWGGKVKTKPIIVSLTITHWVCGTVFWVAEPRTVSTAFVCMPIEWHGYTKVHRCEPHFGLSISENYSEEINVCFNIGLGFSNFLRAARPIETQLCCPSTH